MWGANAVVEMHGTVASPTWTRLSATANINDTSITVEHAVVGWSVGDKIIVASTDYYQELTEEFTITAIGGGGHVITLDRGVKYLHWGKDYERAEVGLLSRKIVIQGDPSSDATLFGGGLFLRMGQVRLSGVEVARSGQQGVLGRYPVHLHLLGATSNVYVKDSSIHHNYQRCLTIHKSSNIVVQRNVAYRTFGHCYFLEDGGETKNIFDRNLGAVVLPMSPPLTPTDTQPTPFWITNPDNTYTNNAAVGGQFGFWYSLPPNPTGKSVDMTTVFPRFTPLGVFSDNVAHSATEAGLQVDDCIIGTNADGSENLQTELCGYSPIVAAPGVNITLKTRAYDAGITQVPATFSRLLAYKNRFRGAWLRGSLLVVTDSIFVDNAIGSNAPADRNLFVNCLYIGETDNIGTPGFTKWFNDLGRSRPRLWATNFPITGWQQYDASGPMFSINNTFVNFATNDVRRAGAIGALENGPNIFAGGSAVLKGSTLINSNEFAMMDNTANADGPKMVSIQDADGTVTGVLGGYIVSNATTQTYGLGCTPKPAWGSNPSFLLCPPFYESYIWLSLVNQDVAGSNFGNSLNDFYRVKVTPFGSPVGDDLTGGNPRYPKRDNYNANVIGRRGYAFSFNHPTPYHFVVSAHYVPAGEWVVVALAYPSTSFTLTRGYGETAMTPVSSLDQLSATTYHYDANGQWLYVMYYEEGQFSPDHFGMPSYGWGSGSIRIKAGCGSSCTTAGRAVPSGLPANLLGSSPDVFYTGLTTCTAGSSSSAISSTAKGLAYIRWNSSPSAFSLHYNIYHSVSNATKITVVDHTTGKLIYTLRSSGAPVRGMFSLTRDAYSTLFRSGLTIKIASQQHPTGEISGIIGCSQGGGCTPPSPTWEVDACTVPAGTVPVFNDTLGKWQSWSWNVPNTLFNYTGDVLCGSKSIRASTASWGSLAFHIGNCYAGSAAGCKSWETPYVPVGSLKYVEFYAKSNGQDGDAPLVLNVCLQSDVAADATCMPGGFVPPKYISNWAIVNTWTRVRIPISEFGLSSSNYLGLVRIYPANGAATVFYLDEIRLITENNEPMTPTLSASNAYKYDAVVCDGITSGGDGGSSGSAGPGTNPVYVPPANMSGAVAQHVGQLVMTLLVVMVLLA
eukprot:TRINITY_DN363_c0_g1_i2.p1 TRINITY_DN363_c0_g1~~TRINITY_DN363_c0_g1_i2.p1  ORF type:complete len:1303 (-),score=241.66 TRINITY_DN363_c0_g1_i2:112-3498(-)